MALSKKFSTTNFSWKESPKISVRSSLFSNFISTLEALAKISFPFIISPTRSAMIKPSFFRGNFFCSILETINKSATSSVILPVFSFRILKYSICFLETSLTLPDIKNSTTHFKLDRGERSWWETTLTNSDFIRLASANLSKLLVMTVAMINKVAAIKITVRATISGSSIYLLPTA